MASKPWSFPQYRNLLSAILILSPAMTRAPLMAQSFYGAIAGTIQDSTGAAVANAPVILVNLKTDQKLSTQTDEAGNYRFVNLVPADYRVEVTAPAFKHFVQGPVMVQVDSTSRIDVRLQLGEINETVTVTSTAPQLDTDSGTVGAVIEGRQVQEMPLNGRNVMNLIALAPGVVPQGGSQGTTANNQGGHTSNEGWGNYQIGGGIAGQGAEFLDGAPLNTLGGNFISLVPTQDAIQEFKVDSSAVSPEFGRFGGGVVELTTKSGGNQFHGGAWEYVRNKIFNADDFFSKLNGVDRQKWNQNQYGALFTGPLKREKAFFLFSWEGFSARIGSPTETNVPTDAMKTGVFAGEHLTDPTGRCAIAYNAATNTSAIPSTCMDSTAAIIKNYWPSPNSTNATDNYFSSPVSGNDANQYNGRVDYAISDKQRFFARYSWWALSDIPPSVFNDANGFKTENAHSDNRTQQGVLGDTYTFNPTTILDVRASYTRQFFDNRPGSLGVDESEFGTAYAALASQMTYHVNPNVILTGIHNLWQFYPMTQLSQDYYDNYSLSGSVTRIIGNHSLKFGAEGRLMDRSSTGDFDTNSGLFDFLSTQYTGDEFANFLLGYASDGTIATGSLTAAYNWYKAFFINDTWQASSKLTLNYGLRHELPGAIAERNNKATVLLPNTTDPTTGASGTLTLVNSSLWPSRYTNIVKNNLIAPRIGIAYRATNSTVLRAGYAINYLPPDLQMEITPAYSPINGATTTFENGSTPTTLLANPFPNGIIQSTGRSNPAFMTTLLGQQLISPAPTSNYPYMHQWNLTVGQQLPGSISLEVSYLGSNGVHLPISGASASGYNDNELNSKYYGLGSALLNPVSTGSTTTLGQSLRPHPAFLNMYDTAAFFGSTSYNGLQVQSQKRFKDGGTLMVAYTWSKTMGDADTLNYSLEPKASGNVNNSGAGFVQDWNNLSDERSLLSFDTRNRAVISYVTQLPLGKGKRFANNLPAGVDRLVSGWALNGITTFQSGFPIDIYDAGNFLTEDFGGGMLRPNYNPNCNRKLPGSPMQRLNEWFNVNCFAHPGDFAFGNERRVDDVLRSQGIANYDFSLMKSTQLKGPLNLQLRGEFFNIFNHTQFNPPATTLTTTTTTFPDPNAPVTLPAPGNFGAILSQQNQPRLVQLSARFSF